MSGAGPISSGPDWVRLRLHVVPGARISEFSGLHGDAIKLKVRAPARDGAANEAVLEAIRAVCTVRRDQVELERGHSSREKLVLIKPLATADVRRVLELLARSGYIPLSGIARVEESE